MQNGDGGIGVPLDAIRDYAGALVGLFTAMIAGFWIVVGVLFSAKSEAKRAHTRIDDLERQVSRDLRNLRSDLKQSEERAAARDLRMEDKLDRLIESRGRVGGGSQH